MRKLENCVFIKEMKRLLSRVREASSRTKLNVIAFSGGVDSTVVAAAVHRAFPENSVACIAEISHRYREGSVEASERRKNTWESVDGSVYI